jgi:hypothetical protein
VPIFAAAALAVYRKLPETSTAKPCSRAGESAMPLGAVLVTVVAGASAGLGFVLALPAGLGSIVAVGCAVLALTGAALLGLLLARVGGRLAGGSHLVPLFLLLSAVGWAFGHRAVTGEAGASLLRLTVVTGCGAACVLSCTPRRMGAERRGPGAFSRQKGLLVAAGAVTVALGSAARGRLDAGTLVMLATLVTTAIAGLWLVLEPLVQGWRRAAGLGVVAMWLAVLLLVGDFRVPEPASVQLSDAANAGGAARQVAHQRYAGLGADLLSTSAAGEEENAWDADLRGPSHNAIVLVAEHVGATPGFDPRSARRLLRRCGSALQRGGDLIVELPADELVDAAFDWARRAAPDRGADSYLLKVSAAGGNYAALVLGPGVSAWVRQHTWPEGVEVALFDVHGARELRERLAGDRRPRYPADSAPFERGASATP